MTGSIDWWIYRRFCIVLMTWYTVGCTSLTVAQPVKPALTIDKQALTKRIKRLTDISPPRNYSNPASLNRAADLIKQEFESFGYRVTFQPYDVQGVTYKNVIASYDAAQLSTAKKRRLIVGAHYDVYGDFQGADDNASGVAGLLEVARLLQSEKPRLPYTVDLVAYTLEEPPFFRGEHMGSFVHANSLKQSGADIIGMVCLEMIGYFTDKKASQSYPLSLMKLFYPSTGDFIAVVGNYASSKLVRHVKKNMAMTDVAVSSLKAPSFITGVDFSDHMNYWKHGFAAVMITDTSFYRNHRYHTPLDTVDTLNIDKMAEVIRGVYYAVINLRDR